MHRAAALSLAATCWLTACTRTPGSFDLVLKSGRVVDPETGLDAELLLGTAVWLMGPVPMWIWNYFFMKVHRLILLSGILGWFVRLGVSALVVGMLLS